MNAAMLEDPAQPVRLDAVVAQTIGGQRQAAQDLFDLGWRKPITVAVDYDGPVHEPRAARSYPWQRQVTVKKCLEPLFHATAALVPALRTNSRRSGCTWQTMRPSGVSISRRSKRPTGARPLNCVACCSICSNKRSRSSSDLVSHS